MANLNKVMLIGRLTRDVETRTFSNGGKVAKFGFAVSSNRRKNQQTGKWEDEPCYLDVEVFNRGEFGKKADTAEQYLSKGKQIFIEGHLKMESWTGQDGQKRNKIVVVCEHFEFLDARSDGTGGAAGGSRFGHNSRTSYDAPNPDDMNGDIPNSFSSDDQKQEDIPF
ncbi:MAG TPA: single-stranded DNA-binding protein [Gemmatales bacterium]|nr:single-stranded DNA-binding protein [Gemmatales bacterium]HMP18256.1 single-stranded DNA-binding protein [Gemmatales bacterium]